MSLILPFAGVGLVQPMGAVAMSSIAHARGRFRLHKHWPSTVVAGVAVSVTRILFSWQRGRPSPSGLHGKSPA